MKELLKRFKNRERRSLAKLISIIEDELPEREEILKEIHVHTGRARILGVTGAPGAGKSSMVDKLVEKIRKREESVGIIAVDPTSPFTGGALLGDRIRMQAHALDKDVFIRSMGTRGSLGGLARATKDVVKVMDAFGKDWVIIETVGVGQAELDIIHVADTVVVVLTPGSGDSIQTIKAGLMEIADVFAINKCDLPGADKIATEVEAMLDLRNKEVEWRPPVNLVSAFTGEGLDDLLNSIEKHHNFLLEKEIFQAKRGERMRSEVLSIVNYRWQQMVSKQLKNGPVNAILDKVTNKELDPYSAATQILQLIIREEDLYKKAGG